MFLKQSTAVSVPIALVDDTDFDTGESGFAVGDLTVKIWETGGGTTWTTLTSQVTTLGLGWFTIDLTTTDTGTLGWLALQVTASGAAVFRDRFQVVEEIPGNQDFAVTTTDAERIAAITLSMPVGDVRAHADADSTAMAATSGVNSKILANSILATTGRSGIVSTVATIYREDDTTAAVIRTATYAGAGSELVAGLA